MNHTTERLLETIGSAGVVADQLRARLTIKHDVMDLGDLVDIQSTVKKLEVLLSTAMEYEVILRDRLQQTAARVARRNGVDSAGAL